VGHKLIEHDKRRVPRAGKSGAGYFGGGWSSTEGEVKYRCRACKNCGKAGERHYFRRDRNRRTKKSSSR